MNRLGEKCTIPNNWLTLIFLFIFKEKITLFYNFHKTLHEILLSFYPSGASLLISSKLGHVTSGLWERGCAYTCGSETRSIWFPWSKCRNNISRNTNRYFGVIYFQKIFVLLANVSKSNIFFNVCPFFIARPLREVEQYGLKPYFNNAGWITVVALDN